MRSLLSKVIIFYLLVAPVQTIIAQKDIGIDDSLAANASKLNVKMGTQGFGKIWKFHFGDYGVVSSKAGWSTTSSKGNFFNTKTESKSTDKFSFIMTNKGNDSARVNAASNINVQALQEVQILPNFSWGSNEVLSEKNNFSAYISINGDTTEIWALLMNILTGSRTENSFEALLTNGDRKILLLAATSDKDGKGQSNPARGYEFVENQKSLGAVQYLGSGLLGLNKNIVWLDNRLDEKMKLILAAAMTAVMQKKMNDMGHRLD